MIGIDRIGTYVPDARERNAEHAARFEVGEDFITAKVGVLEHARKAPDEETSDLCVRAFEALQAKTSLDPATVDCLVVCTQNPDGRGLPHSSALVHGKLGVGERCAAWDVSLGCSGFVYVLAQMQAFMDANGLERGLLFTADPYSKIVDRNDKNTFLLFGDGATATLLTSTPRYRMTAGEFSTRGAESSALVNRDGTLYMNGRAIFNFAVTTVPGQVQSVMDRRGWRVDDVDRFVFHQASKFVLDMLVKRLQLPAEKVPMQLEKLGNTVSSSIPMLLDSIVDAERDERLIMSGFGVGLSWATGVLERVQR